MSTIAIIALVVVLLLLTGYISVYNTIKRNRNQIENAKSSLDALFIKRNELIPNLVAVVEQATSYEKGVLENITALRQAMKTNTENYISESETDSLVKRLMVQVENYPELKANQQFTRLQYTLNECEEQISAGRRYLSSSITIYNNSVTTFPGNLIGGMAGMSVHEWERATPQQRERVDVKGMFTPQPPTGEA
ncbi:MAG: LemA family protein [Tannerellaceae bacterium]|nr:LemA family protein [Tannerellaceae bacterium]